MKIGDRVYVRGYVDEIRNGFVIIRNKGGYFGTDVSEALEEKEQNLNESTEKIREEGYQKGLEDAWELAGKVTLPPSQEGMTAEEILDCFDVVNEWYVLRSPVSVAKEKYDAWKAKKEQDDEIRIGDVVEAGGREYVVIKEGQSHYGVIDLSDKWCGPISKQVTKTGKHYDLPWVKVEPDTKRVQKMIDDWREGQEKQNDL